VKYKTGKPHYRNPGSKYDENADDQDFLNTPECRIVQILLLAYAYELHGTIRASGRKGFTVKHLPLGWVASDLHRLKSDDVELYGDAQ
jgi:hypothetical protein